MIQTFAPSTLPDGYQLPLRITPTPADTNAGGNIFGGWLMSQVDIAASICAYAIIRGPFVTRAVNAFQFLKPIHVGDLVSCYCLMVQQKTSSLTIDAQVYVQRGREPDVHIKVATAELVFVAIDEQHRPTKIQGGG